jgi:hypothetical protein
MQVMLYANKYKNKQNQGFFTENFRAAQLNGINGTFHISVVDLSILVRMINQDVLLLYIDGNVVERSLERLNNSTWLNYRNTIIVKM